LVGNVLERSNIWMSVLFDIGKFYTNILQGDEGSKESILDSEHQCK